MTAALFAAVLVLLTRVRIEESCEQDPASMEFCEEGAMRSRACRTYLTDAERGKRTCVR